MKGKPISVCQLRKKVEKKIHGPTVGRRCSVMTASLLLANYAWWNRLEPSCLTALEALLVIFQFASF